MTNDMKESLLLLFAFLGVMALIMVLFGFFAVYADKHDMWPEGDHGEPEFDERQKLIKGKAGRISFFILIAELAILLFCDMANVSLPLTAGAAYGIMILSSAGTYIIYLILNDADIGIHKKVGSYKLNKFMTRVILPITYIFFTIEYWFLLREKRPVFSDGKLTSTAFFPLGAVVLLIMLITSIYVRHRDIRAEKEDESGEKTDEESKA